jgi:RNA polymerase sigma-70 factor (ECF subfamily)
MSSPPATAPDLVRGLRAGRRDAFERLYGEYHASIYNLCARVLGDREEAKDVTQEVFIKAFDQLPQEDEESFRLRAWLYRVATNACFNHLRSRRKLDRGGDAGLEQAASGVDEFERARTVAMVEQSLGEMNERYRTALVLKDLQGLPPEEIAEVMAVSRANADVLVHRARASFKTVYARLAGSDATAPAALGLVLLPLSVPAALQAMPPVLASLAPAAQTVIPATAGPAGVGLLAKIGAALTAKAAITAAAAAVVIGGGAVAVKEAGRGDRGPAPAAATAAPAGATSQPSSPCTVMHDRHQAGHGTPRGEHGGAARHGESGAHTADHAGSGSHDAATHEAGGGSATTTHDAGGGSAKTTHDGGSSTSSTTSHPSSTTTTHGGDDTSGSHEGSGD